MGWNLNNKYLNRDARGLYSLFRDKSIVDVTITSPPYWNLKDYNSHMQIGCGQTYENFMDDLSTVFSEVYQVTKPKGSLWVISDTIKIKGQMKLFPFDLANRLQSVGWMLQDVIIWNKDKTIPWSHKGKMRSIFEYILFFPKGPILSTDYLGFGK